MRNCHFQRVTQILRVRCHEALGAKRSCQRGEVGAAEVRCNQPVVIIVHLKAPDIAESVIVENHRRQGNIVMHGCGKLGDREKGAAVAADRHNGNVSTGMRDTKGGWKSVSEGSLIPGRNETARPVTWESEARNISRLGQFIDENPLLW